MGTGDRAPGRAVEEDPDFALAHIYLAHGYANRGSHALAEPHFVRAFALAEEASEPERHFIVGSYHQRYTRDLARARAAYQTLVQLHPDHYWAINNLSAIAVDERRIEERVALRRRLAQIRPNSITVQLQTGWEVMTTTRDLEAANAYMSKALALYEADEAELRRYDAERILTFRAIERWLLDDIDGAHEALSEAERRLSVGDVSVSDETLEWVGWLRLGLGELDRALELYRRIQSPGRRHTALALHAIARGDEVAVRDHRLEAGENMAELTPPLPIGLFPHLLLAGGEEPSPDLGFAEEWTRANAQRYWRPEPYLLLARGEALARRGDYSAAEAALEEGVRRCSHHPTSAYLLGLESLSQARYALGDVEGALAALAPVSNWRERSLPSSMFFWMRSRLREANLLRELGRADQAETIETQLLHLLSRSDEDYILRRRLGDRLARARRLGS